MADEPKTSQAAEADTAASAELPAAEAAQDTVVDVQAAADPEPAAQADAGPQAKPEPELKPETPQAPRPVASDSAPASQDERLTPGIAYGLYAATVFGIPSAPVGVLLAHLNQGKGNQLQESHYRFQIRSFWIGLAMLGALALLLGIGAILSVILIGIPILFAAMFGFGALWVWFCIRAAAGAFYLYRREPYPRPDSWVI